MPYFKREDLPATVKNVLPKGAQEIYRKAFNKMWDMHRDPKTLPQQISRVEVAAIIAWSAVKKEYIKKKTRWVKKQGKEYSQELKAQLLKELSKVPGIGKDLAKELWAIGIRFTKDLRHQNPETLFHQLTNKRKNINKSVLYKLHCAIYYVSHTKHNPALLKWWNWKTSNSKSKHYDYH